MVDYREDAHWSVYIHIVPKAISGYEYDKYYVGITGNNPEKRWKDGRGYSKNNQRMIFYAIKKYGWNNIEHHIIAENITYSEACSLEISLISILNSYGKYGYNLTNGGEGVSGMIPSTVKQVHQFDIDGNYIASYVSIQEASRQTNISAACICKNIKENKKPSGATQYIWRDDNGVYYKDEKYHLKDKNELIHYEVYQFDLEGNYLSRYVSITHAAKATGLSTESISNHLKNKDMIRLNDNCPFFWRRANKVYFENDTYKMIIDNDVKRTVYVFNEEFCYLNKYSSCKEAGIATGVLQGTVQYRASSKATRPLTNPKIFFRYEEDVEEQSDGTYKMLR